MKCKSGPSLCGVSHRNESTVVVVGYYIQPPLSLNAFIAESPKREETGVFVRINKKKFLKKNSKM